MTSALFAAFRPARLNCSHSKSLALGHQAGPTTKYNRDTDGWMQR